jgi:hypothetical protein
MKWRVLVPVLAAAALRLGFIAGVRDQSLREAAQSSGVLIGTAVRPAQLSEVAYASTLAREFNMLEPEDVLKWRRCTRSRSLSISLTRTRLWISQSGTA